MEIPIGKNIKKEITNRFLIAGAVFCNEEALKTCWGRVGTFLIEFILEPPGIGLEATWA